MEETLGSQTSRAVGKKLNESLYRRSVYLFLCLSTAFSGLIDFFPIQTLFRKYTLSVQFRDELVTARSASSSRWDASWHCWYSASSWLRLAKGYGHRCLWVREAAATKRFFVIFLASSHAFFFDNSAISCDVAIKWLSYLRVGIYKSAKEPALCECTQTFSTSYLSFLWVGVSLNSSDWPGIHLPASASAAWV